MDKKVLHFNMDTSYIKIKEIMKNKDFISIEFWAISNEYPNNNNSHFTLESMEKNIERGSFFNKPILGKFNNTTNNYETHNYKEKYDPELDLVYYDYEDGERPLGLIRESDNVRIETDENGLKWIVFSAVIWVKYNYMGVKKILKSKKSKVSVEVTILSSHIDENNVEIFDDWVFDGVTILGYRPNTMSPVKEGINNACLSIVERMQEHLFDNHFKVLQFAYDELENKDTDIDENESHLYIENNEKGGVKLFTYEQKREILNGALIEQFKTIREDENEYCWLRDYDDDFAYIVIDCVVYRIPYSMNEDNEVTFDFDSKVRVVIDYKEFVEDDCGGCDDCKKDVEDTSTDGDSDNNNEEDNKQNCDCDDTNDDKDDADDTQEDECSNNCKMSETFVINEQEFTAQELFEKYLSDMSEINAKFDELQSSYGRLVVEKNELFESYEAIKTEKDVLQKDFEELSAKTDDYQAKIQEFEQKEKDAKIEALCFEVKDMATKESFSEDVINDLMDRCKKEEFVTKEDAIKEIAYISFKNKQEVQKHEEFSAKVPNGKTVDNTDSKKTKTSFDNLTDYVSK